LIIVQLINDLYFYSSFSWPNQLLWTKHNIWHRNVHCPAKFHWCAYCVNWNFISKLFIFADLLWRWDRFL